MLISVIVSFLAAVLLGSSLVFAASPACAYDLPCESTKSELPRLLSGSNLDVMMAVNNLRGKFSSELTHISTSGISKSPLCCFTQELRRCIVATAHQERVWDKLNSVLPVVDEQLKISLPPNCTLPDLGSSSSTLSHSASSWIFGLVILAFSLLW